MRSFSIKTSGIILTTAMVVVALARASAAENSPPFKRLADHGGTCVSFSPDGKRLLTADHDSAVVWDLADAKVVTAVLRCRGVLSAQFAAHGSRVFVDGSEEARVWNVAKSDLVCPPMRHLPAAPFGGSIDDDGKIAVTIGETNKVVAVWDAATGKRLRSLRHAGPVRNAILTRRGDIVLSIESTPDRQGFERGLVIHLWDVGSGRDRFAPIKVIFPFDWKPPAAFTSDGNKFAIPHSWHSMAVYETRTGKKLGDNHQSVATVGMDSGLLQQLIFDPTGTKLFTLTSSYQQIYDAATCKPITEPWDLISESAAFSPDGRRILLEAYDEPSDKRPNRFAGIWDITPQMRVQDLGIGDVSVVAYSPDGKHIAAGYDDYTGGNTTFTRVWPVVTDKPK